MTDVLSVARVAMSCLNLADVYLNMIDEALHRDVAQRCWDFRNMSDVADLLSLKRSCCATSDLDMIPTEYWDVIEAEMVKLVKEDYAARVIQQQWHSAISDPGRVMCQTRLLTEFEELCCV